MPKGIYYNRGLDNSEKMQKMRAFWREQYQLRKNELKLKRINKKITKDEEEVIKFKQSLYRYLRKYKVDNILYLNKTKRLNEICKYFDNNGIKYVLKNKKIN